MTAQMSVGQAVALQTGMALRRGYDWWAPLVCPPVPYYGPHWAVIYAPEACPSYSVWIVPGTLDPSI